MEIKGSNTSSLYWEVCKIFGAQPIFVEPRLARGCVPSVFFARIILEAYGRVHIWGWLKSWEKIFFPVAMLDLLALSTSHSCCCCCWWSWWWWWWCRGYCRCCCSIVLTIQRQFFGDGNPAEKSIYKRPRKHWPFSEGLSTLAKVIRFGVDWNHVYLEWVLKHTSNLAPQRSRCVMVLGSWMIPEIRKWVRKACTTQTMWLESSQLLNIDPSFKGHHPSLIPSSNAGMAQVRSRVLPVRYLCLGDGVFAAGTGGLNRTSPQAEVKVSVCTWWNGWSLDFGGGWVPTKYEQEESLIYDVGWACSSPRKCAAFLIDIMTGCLMLFVAASTFSKGWWMYSSLEEAVLGVCACIHPTIMFWVQAGPRTTLQWACPVLHLYDCFA